MIAAPELEKQPYRIACGTVWGGIKPVSLDVCTKGVTVSLHSTASGGDRGGDIYYISVCTSDLRTRMLVADVRGHGERVSKISSWICQSLQDKMNSVDCAEVLSDLNQMVHTRGSAAITTAAVVSHDISDSKLYYAYAGHPPRCFSLGSIRLGRSAGASWRPHPALYGWAVGSDESGIRRRVRRKEIARFVGGPGGRRVGEPKGIAGRGRYAFLGAPILTDDCTLMVVEIR